ncbi:MAG: hypothetical protein H7239_10230 [Flavobacterium sp.]|nr:hypothetical protein [Flavobacterium sp.]
MNLREELIAYDLKMSNCTDEQSEIKVDSYLSVINQKETDLENKKINNPLAPPCKIQGVGYEGMTLRDYFANSAMQGICADGHTFWDSSSIQGDPINIARLSFEIANAMLKQRGL